MKLTYLGDGDMENEMNNEQFNKVMARLDVMDAKMVTKQDVFQAVMTVQGFTFAIIVGLVVVLNTLGAFG